VAPVDTGAGQVHQQVLAASAVSTAVAAADRRPWLLAIAAALGGHTDELVGLAGAESHLPSGRLQGELLRTTDQLGLFADVLAEGSYLDAQIDHAVPTAAPPLPDLRRATRPLGPVAVFTASNFPFAFSVAGGDTASALAAGCPVVVKAHPGHPRLSARVAELTEQALLAAGAPAGVFSVVYGVASGQQLVQHPHIAAVAFTGSQSGGRALLDFCQQRPDPIPFYGELGSLNPVVVTSHVDTQKGRELAQGFVDSFTLGVGQFCTKPGVLLHPAGSSLPQHVAELARLIPAAPMLNDRISGAYEHQLEHLSKAPGVQVLLHGADGAPTVLATSAETVLADPEVLLAECFGPAAMLVSYHDVAEIRQVLTHINGSLTTTIFGHPEDSDSQQLMTWASELSGRVIWNGWPTGVAVSWAMHHGGPWPATTNAQHTSVGASAIRRFLRPVSYQSVPDALLPPALREANPLGVPRRVDGVLSLPSPAAPR